MSFRIVLPLLTLFSHSALAARLDDFIGEWSKSPDKFCVDGAGTPVKIRITKNPNAELKVEFSFVEIDHYVTEFTTNPQETLKDERFRYGKPEKTITLENQNQVIGNAILQSRTRRNDTYADSDRKKLVFSESKTLYFNSPGVLTLVFSQIGGPVNDDDETNASSVECDYVLSGRSPQSVKKTNSK